LRWTLSSWADVDEVRQGILVTIFFVVLTLESVKLALLAGLCWVIASKADTVQVKFVFDFRQIFVQFVCSLQTVVKDSVDVLFVDFLVGS
jgi:hypothetical protein